MGRMETEGASKPDMCSRCGIGKVSGDGTPRWCPDCKASYQREYRALKDGRAERKGFSAGVVAMRERLAEEFDRLGSGGFSAYEVAELIRRAPGPKVD